VLYNRFFLLYSFQEQGGKNDETKAVHKYGALKKTSPTQVLSNYRRKLWQFW